MEEEPFVISGNLSFQIHYNALLDVILKVPGRPCWWEKDCLGGKGLFSERWGGRARQTLPQRTVHLELHKYDGKSCNLRNNWKGWQHLGYSLQDQRWGNICKILSHAGQSAHSSVVYVTNLSLHLVSRIAVSYCVRNQVKELGIAFLIYSHLLLCLFYLKVDFLLPVQ